MATGRLQGSAAWACTFLALLFATSPVLAAPFLPARMAITVDDLPIFPELPSGRQAIGITQRLLAGFKRHRWPVTGFVNEGQLENHPVAGRSVLKAWVLAGFDLGNHTYSHSSLSVTSVHEFLHDVVRGDHVTRPMLAAVGKRESWFRYPYLATGLTLKDRRQAEIWLASHHYRIAPVSVSNSDWEFAEPYDAALKRGDRARALAIRQAYLDYTKKEFAWTRAMTQQILGREPAYILLIHASRLNAESIEPLAAIFTASGFAPIPLSAAVADSAYHMPDRYVGVDGKPSLDRWALALGKQIPKAGQPQIPADVAADYRRIEAADPDARMPLPEGKTK